MEVILLEDTFLAFKNKMVDDFEFMAGRIFYLCFKLRIS